MKQFERVDTFSNRLKIAMDLRDKKQIDLVRETGINKSAISRYISGEYEPKNEPVYAIAKALNVSDQWLWGYDFPMERPSDQKELDELSDLNERMKKEKDFRQLIMKISHLKPKQLEAVKNLLEAFPHE